jgi:hypothetical protein
MAIAQRYSYKDAPDQSAKINHRAKALPDSLSPASRIGFAV